MFLKIDVVGARKCTVKNLLYTVILANVNKHCKF